MHPSTGAPSDLIGGRLDSDVMWRHFTQDGRWICPYCLTAVRSPQSGKVALVRSIERHLGQRCPGFNKGQGQHQPLDQIESRMRYEDIVLLATSDPAWQIFDHEGYWYSPYSLRKVSEVRVTKGAIDGFVIRRMAEHLGTCPFYRAGKIHPAGEVQATRDRSLRLDKVSSDIRRLLRRDLWRYHDVEGRWICPYCLGRVAEVNFRRAPPQDQTLPMATHLLEGCPNFRPDAQRLQSEERVRQESGLPPAAPGAAAGRAGEMSPLPMRRRTARPAGEGAPATPTRAAPGTAEATPVSVPLDGAGAAPPVARPAVRAGLFGADGTQAVAGSLLDRLGRDDDRDANVIKPMPASIPDVDDPSGISWLDGLSREMPEPGTDAVSHTPSREEDVELEQARSLQKGLLPQAPVLPGYRFATRYEGCSHVSGDFYEFIALSDGRLGFALGDVSGHGMQAGLIMSMAKKTLAIYARAGGRPADVVAAVNDALVEDLGGRHFITMIYAILDPGERSITWVRAGHDPVLRFNTHTRDLSLIQPPGMVVGMKAGRTFTAVIQEEVTHLQSGDLLLLYTDGITEAMNRQGEEYGHERLQELARDHGDEDLERMLDRIMDSVRSFRGATPAKDDVTLVALAVD